MIYLLVDFPQAPSARHRVPGWCGTVWLDLGREGVCYTSTAFW